MATVLLTDDAIEDIRELDGSAKKLVLKALKKLEDNPQLRGFPLGNNPKGNLTGLRKLVIGDRDYRAVYRVESDGKQCWSSSLQNAQTTRSTNSRSLD